MNGRREWIGIAVGLLSLAVLILVIVIVFNLRLRRGDLYPAYSSLRADPLGTRVLYESLDAMDGLVVQRNFDPHDKMPLDRPATLLFLGDELESRPEWEWIPGDWVGRMNAFLRRGGRLVILLAPRDPSPLSTLKDDWDEDGDEDEDDNEQEDDAKTDDDETVDEKDPTAGAPASNTVDEASVDLEKETGPEKRRREREKKWLEAGMVSVTNWLTLSYTNLDTAVETAQLRDNEALGFPSSIVVHSSTIFTNLGTDWRTIYAADEGPVMIERSMGNGSVVISSASFFVSNEALRHDRQPALLAWLIGHHSTVLFDETHLGLRSSHNIAMLMRRYGLSGLAAGLALLAILFAWNSAYSLVPRTELGPARETGFAAGKDSVSGLTNLLQRHVPRSDLFAVCLREWRRTRSTRRPSTIDVSDTGLLAQGRQSPVDAYNQFAKNLNDKGEVQR